MRRVFSGLQLLLLYFLVREPGEFHTWKLYNLKLQLSEFLLSPLGLQRGVEKNALEQPSAVT